MEIQIEPEPLVIGTIDLPTFKIILQKDLDLERAINASIRITQNPKNKPEEQIINFVRWQLDWGDIIHEIHQQPQKKTMNWNITQIQTNNRRTYDVGSTDTQHFHFKESPSPNIECIVIQDLIPKINYTLALNLSRSTFTFSNKKWQPITIQR